MRRGELIAVVGPNGAGKTTLLKLLAGLQRPARGCTCIDGVNIWDLDEEHRLNLRRRLVYVHEEPVMLRGSALDNAAAGLVLRGVPRSEAKERAMKALERLGLRDIAGARARGLSRGQRQLVALARALALEPAGLLLDEPFAHLDRSRRRLLLDVLREAMERGAAVAVATHSPVLVRRLASRLLLVEGGVVEERPAEELEELLV